MFEHEKVWRFALFKKATARRTLIRQTRAFVVTIVLAKKPKRIDSAQRRFSVAPTAVQQHASAIIIFNLPYQISDGVSLPEEFVKPQRAVSLCKAQMSQLHRTILLKVRRVAALCCTSTLVYMIESSTD